LIKQAALEVSQVEKAAASPPTDDVELRSMSMSLIGRPAGRCGRSERHSCMLPNLSCLRAVREVKGIKLFAAPWRLKVLLMFK
jgi:hypothetical protein